MRMFDSFKATLKGHFDKKKEDREFEDRLRLEAAVQERQLYEQRYKLDALEVAKMRAETRSEKDTGLLKLRAINDRIRLKENSIAPGSGFDKLRDYTQKNIARREANLKRTATMRSSGLKIQQDRVKGKGIVKHKAIRQPFERTTPFKRPTYVK